MALKRNLSDLLGNWGKIPVTYAGGVGDFEDLARAKKTGKKQVKCYNRQCTGSFWWDNVL